MKGVVVVSTSIFIVARQVAESRCIRDDAVVESTVTCEATYGFLPCSTSIWGLLFLIVVYNILLSMAGQYVGTGSDLFFQIIGPGVVGGSVFQFLGSIPRLVVLLVPLLTGSEAEAQERVSAGMGMVLGGVAMLLTFIWGLTVIIGSYDQSQDDDDDSQSQITTTTVTGSAVVTDIETSWTARLILLASVPFVILEFQNLFTSQSAKRVVILIALIVTVTLLCAYIVFQSFRPWIQNRCFEYMMETYAKDKLLKLISSNGRPDTRKIQQLFNKIAKDNSASVTAAEIRALALGIKMDDEDAARELYLDRMTAYFDTTGDGVISRDEFIEGMTNLASSLLDDQSPANNNAQNGSEEQEALLGSSTRQRGSHSWGIYLRASSLLIIGTGMAYVLSEPLVSSVISLANAANIPSFWISYIVLPIALNYNGVLQSVASALEKDQKTNSLTLSSLYGRVLMNNLMGLIPFLAPVYFRNLSSDVSAELLLVLAICVGMGLYTSFNTTFPRWTGFLVLTLYPISLLSLYLLTSVLGWS